MEPNLYATENTFDTRGAARAFAVTIPILDYHAHRLTVINLCVNLCPQNACWWK